MSDILIIINMIRLFKTATVILFFIYYAADLYSYNNPLKKNILIINSYHKGFTWTDNIVIGVESVLKSSIRNAEITVEYMDTKRYSGDQYFRRLYDLYAAKYSEVKFDVVICSDNDAFYFLIKHRAALFKSAPVVFSGVNNFTESLIKDRGHFTGVIEDTDLLSTINIALCQNPDAKRAVIINDKTTTGAAMKNEFNKIISRISRKIDIEFFEHFTRESLKQKVASIPDDSIIILLAVNRDMEGGFYTYEEGLDIVRLYANAPIYGVWDFLLGGGIVGGMLTSGFHQGEAAGKLATRIVNGEECASVGIITKSPNIYMFDYRELNRFGIDPDEIPEGSIVLNRPFSIYDTYKKYITAVVLFIIFLSVAIVVLMFNFRKRIIAERSANDARTYLDKIINTISEPVFVKEFSLGYILVNDSFCHFMEYQRDAILGKNEFDLFPVEQADSFRRIDSSIFDTGNETTVEEQLYSMDGRLRYVIIRKTLFVDSSGKKYIVGIIFDITERKRVEISLAEEKEMLAVTLGSIGDGVITTDRDDCVILMNSIAEKLTGWEFYEAIGRKISEIITLTYEAGSYGNMHDLDKHDYDTNMKTFTEATLLSKNGDKNFVSYSSSHINDSGGFFRGAVHVVRDISERKRMEEEIIKNEKLKSLGVLAGGIAHDFNNLLTGIMGNISLARLIIDDNPEARELLTESENASEKAKALTSQLLTFARGGSPVKTGFDLSTLIKNQISLMLKGSEIKYELSVDEKLWKVEADENQILQVVKNLLQNSIQAMDSAGSISVNVSNESILENSDSGLQPGKYVKVSIADNGNGIPAEIINRIFDPFFTTKINCNGLGLASAYSIIKKHGGRINVESAYGRGAKFWFYLPSSFDDCEKIAAVPETTGDKKRRILVVDDDEAIRKLVEKMLKHLGFEAISCVDGDEALKLYSDSLKSGCRFDMVITDLTIPGGMGGEELIKRLLEVDSDVVAVVSSGYSNDPVMASFREYGFKASIMKPYRIDDLQNTIKSVI